MLEYSLKTKNHAPLCLSAKFSVKEGSSLLLHRNVNGNCIAYVCNVQYLLSWLFCRGLDHWHLQSSLCLRLPRPFDIGLSLKFPCLREYASLPSVKQGGQNTLSGSQNVRLMFPCYSQHTTTSTLQILELSTVCTCLWVD